ncbi:MAG TPA: exodeoxyribonuclease VII small subunit [Solirubrobacteraceae bacterium]
MSDPAQSQAIMFEPTDELELRAGGAGLDGADGTGLESADGTMLEGIDGVGLEGAGRAEPGPVGASGADGVVGREQITFEQGYEELKRIVSRLDDPELPVHEMFEGFRRGKGLEKALRAYLQEREGELVELEEGNNLPEFEIASPSNG